jgi:hypothetical protein
MIAAAPEREGSFGSATFAQKPPTVDIFKPFKRAWRRVASQWLRSQDISSTKAGSWRLEAWALCFAVSSRSRGVKRGIRRSSNSRRGQAATPSHPGRQGSEPSIQISVRAQSIGSAEGTGFGRQPAAKNSVAVSLHYRRSVIAFAERTTNEHMLPSRSGVRAWKLWVRPCFLWRSSPSGYSGWATAAYWYERRGRQFRGRGPARRTVQPPAVHG